MAKKSFLVLFVMSYIIRGRSRLVKGGLVPLWSITIALAI